MAFQSSAGDRVLPPIMTLKPSSPPTNSNVPKPVLPPVSCLAPPLISPLTSPAEFTNNSNPLHIPQSTQPYLLSPQKSDHSTPHTPSNGHFHFQPDTPTTQQQYVDQQRSQPFSPPRAAGSAPPHMQPSSHHPGMMIRPMHHPYAHPIYHQQARPVVDPASELLAEKRRRNAGASARFRDRRKQREREMQEKCQFLERKVQELESTDSAKRIAELVKKLEEANKEKETTDQKLQEQEKEILKLRARLCEREFEFLTPPSSTGEYDSKELFDDTSRLSRSPSTSSTSSDHKRKPTDVKSLLS
ncbi:hypothetical protein RclHR1_04440022 [Rhizophagus clarus]|uniref:Regulatory protein cys-3 n=1 Tax=Rhizophagus clarus TaxID=94130 RepID=A0A2Z6S011_9GLOM|nr:hypothetical protein RclHR1_04440022 [Rhizophagus clarus]GES92630.1 regulatory protein cys-3 [Rhizophagus clarus]